MKSSIFYNANYHIGYNIVIIHEAVSKKLIFWNTCQYYFEYNSANKKLHNLLKSQELVSRTPASLTSTIFMSYSVYLKQDTVHWLTKCSIWKLVHTEHEINVFFSKLQKKVWCFIKFITFSIYNTFEQYIWYSRNLLI